LIFLTPDAKEQLKVKLNDYPTSRPVMVNEKTVVVTTEFGSVYFVEK
jgi:hypothetical protein